MNGTIHFQSFRNLFRWKDIFECMRALSMQLVKVVCDDVFGGMDDVHRSSVETRIFIKSSISHHLFVRERWMLVVRMRRDVLAYYKRNLCIEIIQTSVHSM